MNVVSMLPQYSNPIVRPNPLIARKTLYSLIPVRLNGKNGLNPLTAYKIYQAYVLPRLPYGLEVLPLNASQITELKQFYTKTVKYFQSLPVRTFYYWQSAVFPSGSSALCSLRLILSRAGLVVSYVALLLWVAHREEGILCACWCFAN
jgi:hypothetical protein